jgi:hypothetical protein
VADLEGRPGDPPYLLFARNLPSNVSKTQDLRPKIRDFFAIWGVCPLFLGTPPPRFKIPGSATVYDYMYCFSSMIIFMSCSQCIEALCLPMDTFIVLQI